MAADQLTNTQRKTPDEWPATSEFCDWEILDPDGWDRTAPNWYEEWTRPLTRDEFAGRLARSAIQPSMRAAEHVTDAGNMMTTTEACEYAGYLSRSSLIRAISLGRLRPRGVADRRQWTFAKSDLDAYLAGLDTRGNSRGVPRAGRRKQKEAVA